MNYIDSHVHVWTDTFDHYPLAQGIRVEDMETRRFLPEHILAHAKASGVTRVTLVQMSYYQTNNRYMLDVIKAAPQTFRGIAIVDFSSPELARQMQSLKSQGVRGFRIVILDKSAASRLEKGHFNSDVSKRSPSGTGTLHSSSLRRLWTKAANVGLGLPLSDPQRALRR